MATTSEVVLQAVSFLLQALSFLLKVVSFVRPESTKDRACKRKDTTCNHKRQRLYYKLCLFSLSALIPWRRLDVDISTLTPVVERQRRGTRSLSVKHYTVVKLPLRARKVVARVDKTGPAQATDELQKLFWCLWIRFEILLAVTIWTHSFKSLCAPKSGNLNR